MAVTLPCLTGTFRLRKSILAALKSRTNMPLSIKALDKLLTKTERIDVTDREGAVQQLQSIVVDLIGELKDNAREEEVEADRQRMYER